MLAGRGRPEKNRGGVSPVFTGPLLHPDRLRGALAERFVSQPPLAEMFAWYAIQFSVPSGDLKNPLWPGRRSAS
ncbi:hypothetical protein [Streptomyces swartbergensis]|uniref:Uncharacterized protein n=1 Tax=Streptomyces swartbergensis TaxID=487165 RepID=A0A243SB98_9ACTN|nr:hypothetical protein [Streptomyces swartbergensis]OUD05131.1 hypothetical protein CA983_00065 [Streptomyces swartbergensis]